MTCSKCGHQTDGGKFCEQCGASLAGGSADSKAPAETPQAARYTEAAKQASSMYFSFCLKVLKRPYTEMKNAGEQHVLNSIITMVIFALTVPLMFYFASKAF